MGDGERGDHRDQRAEAPEREDEADQEQQVVHAVENVKEPELQELEPGLRPRRIQPDQPGFAIELERPHRPVGRQKAQDRQRADPEARQPRTNRELRLVRLDGVLEEDVEQPLAPEKLHRVG